MDSTNDSSPNFFKHVFNFDDDSKTEICNIIQYTILIIIPIIVLNESIYKYIPQPDEKKGSLEIFAEVIIQLIVTFLGLLIVHRIVVFIPTYSGQKYPESNVVNIVLPVSFGALSLQTNLGQKINILINRVSELWNGEKTNKKTKKNNNGNTKVVQSISGQQMNNAAMNQSLYTSGTAISSLPTNDVVYGSENTVQPQQLPDYNNMYQQNNTPLVGAATPGTNEGFDGGIVAANSVLGGGSFGSSW